MRRFSTVDGNSLGTTFAGDRGRTLMQTQEEKSLIWSMDEDDIVFEDEVIEWRLGDLMDFFLTECLEISLGELIARGWADRKDSGLAFRTGISEDGKMFIKR